METPLQIDLQGIDARPDIRAEIDKHVAQLEERSGRITAETQVALERAAPRYWWRNHAQPPWQL